MSEQTNRHAETGLSVLIAQIKEWNPGEFGIDRDGMSKLIKQAVQENEALKDRCDRLECGLGRAINLIRGIMEDELKPCCGVSQEGSHDEPRQH